MPKPFRFRFWWILLVAAILALLIAIMVVYPEAGLVVLIVFMMFFARPIFHVLITHSNGLPTAHRPPTSASRSELPGEHHA